MRKEDLTPLFLGALLAAGVWWAWPKPAPTVAPDLPAPARPAPSPPTKPAPTKPNKPCWPEEGGAPVGVDAFGKFVSGGRELGGEEIAVDLPDGQHLKNTGGSDGAGLCVFCSIDHAARYQNVPALVGFRDFMRKYPGGGYPEKVDRMLPACAASKGLPAPAYVQHTGGDLEFLRLALKTGRYPAVTYDGRDGVFYQGRIAHMVNLVHLSDKSAVIHDNNYPARYLWMGPGEFAARWKGNGGGWAVVLLSSGPPPPPRH